MAKKIITIGKKGVTERIEGSGPVTSVNIDSRKGAASSDAGSVITERSIPSITSNGGPFSVFTAYFSTYNSETNVVDYTGILDVDDSGEFVLFTPDVPAYMKGETEYRGNSGIFVNTSQVCGAFASLVESELFTIKSGEATVLSQSSSENGFGTRRSFITSNGIECSGFLGTFGIEDFGYLATSGGSALSPQKTSISVISNGAVAFGCPTLGISTAGGDIGNIAILVPEDQLTQDMLDNPLQQFEIIGGRPQATYICGIYKTS